MKNKFGWSIIGLIGVVILIVATGCPDLITDSKATEPGAVPSSIIATDSSTAGQFTITWNAPNLTDAKDKDGNDLTATQVSYKVYYLLTSDISDTATTDAEKVLDIKSQALGKTTPQFKLVVTGAETGNKVTISADAGIYSVVIEAINNTDPAKTTLPAAPTSVEIRPEITSKATEPGVPTSITSNTSTAGEFTMTWDAPELTNALNNVGTALTASQVSYMVFYLLTSDISDTATTEAEKVLDIKTQAVSKTPSQFKVVVTGDATGNKVTISADAGIYSVVIEAINNTDSTKTTLPAAPTSVEITPEITSKATEPGEPTSITPDTSTAGQFTMTWAAPVLTNALNNVGTALTATQVSYKVYYLLTSDISDTATTDAEKVSDIKTQALGKTPPQFQEVATGAATGNTVTITADAGIYSVVIEAINITDPTKMTLPAAPTSVEITSKATEPGEPTSITSDTSPAGGFTMTWDAPDLTNAKNNVGTALTASQVSYMVYYLLTTEITSTATTDAQKVLDIKTQAVSKTPSQYQVVVMGAATDNTVTITAETGIYSVVIEAINNTDYTKTTLPAAPTSVEITAPSQATEPGVPTSITPDTSTAGGFTMTWEAPVLTSALNNVGTALTATQVSYKVYYLLTSDIAGTATTDAEKVSDIKSQALGKTPPQFQEVATGAATGNTVTINADAGIYSVVIEAINNTDPTKTTLPAAPTSVEITSKATEPGEPTSITSDTSPAGGFTMTWDAPDLTNAKNNVGTALTASQVSYMVYYLLTTEITSTATTDAQKVLDIKTQAVSKTPSQYQVVVMGAATGNTVTISADAGIYSVVIEAINNTDSTKTTLPAAPTPVEITAPSQATEPGVPTSITPDTSTAEEFTMTWAAPVLTSALNNVGTALTATQVSYKVYYLLTSDIAGTATTDAEKVSDIKSQALGKTPPQFQEVATGAATGNTVTINADAGIYSVVIEAINITDATKTTLPAAPTSVEITAPSQATEPGVPTSITPDTSTAEEFTMTWAAPVLTSALTMSGLL